MTGRLSLDRTFTDLETAMGNVCVHALDQVRYLADMQSDSNVTRQQLHPLWIEVQAVAARNLLAFRAGLTPDQVRQIQREQVI